MNSAWKDLYWRIRPLFVASPLFKTLEEWYAPDDDGPNMHERHREHHARVLRCWGFLRQFFASRGFTLYDYGPHHNATYPQGKDQFDPVSPGVDDYPYGRRFYETRRNAQFFLPSSFRVWAAQDKFGRDVVIKLVSEDELKVLRYLNTEERRAHPQNHTIPLLDSGAFSGIYFAITPRWDSAFLNKFKTLGELMHCAKVLLEGLDFLHENRVFHGDILEQNIGMNAALSLPHGTNQPPGLRDLSSTRYAYYDFEGSAVYPIETPLEEVFETEYYGFRLRGIPRPNGPFKVFPLDVIGLGLVLQTRLKHIENLVPEMGPFLAGMITDDVEERYTARQALTEFEKLYAPLTPEQLSQRLKSYMWSRKRGTAYMSQREYDEL